MKTATRLVTTMVLLALMVSAAGCTQPIRGDVHITVELKPDLACSLQTELRAPPVSDWLVGLSSEPEGGDETKENGEAEQEKTLEVRRTVRGANEYAALVIHLDVSALQKLVGTGQTVQEIIPWLADLAATSEGIAIPEEILSLLTDVPAPFSRFEVTVDDTSMLWTTYQVRAEVSEGTSRMILPAADVTYHLVMPGSVTDSNSDLREGRALTWHLRQGQGLLMEAQSRVSKLPGGNLVPWVLGGVGLLLLAGICGVVVYLAASRPRARGRSSGPAAAADYSEGYGLYGGSEDSGGYGSAADAEYGGYEMGDGSEGGDAWGDAGSYDDSGLPGDWDGS